MRDKGFQVYLFPRDQIDGHPVYSWTVPESSLDDELPSRGGQKRQCDASAGISDLRCVSNRVSKRLDVQEVNLRG